MCLSTCIFYIGFLVLPPFAALRMVCVSTGVAFALLVRFDLTPTANICLVWVGCISALACSIVGVTCGTGVGFSITCWPRLGWAGLGWVVDCWVGLAFAERRVRGEAAEGVQRLRRSRRRRESPRLVQHLQVHGRAQRRYSVGGERLCVWTGGLGDVGGEIGGWKREEGTRLCFVPFSPP